MVVMQLGGIAQFIPCKGPFLISLLSGDHTYAAQINSARSLFFLGSQQLCACVSGIVNPTSPTSLLYQPFCPTVSEAVHMSKAQFVERNLIVETALPEIGVKTKVL